MATISGVVESKSKAGTGIKVGGVWYNGTTSQLANVKWKSNVSFETDGQNKITSIGSASEPAAAPAAPAAASGSWDDRQAVIVFQSARNAATDLFRVMCEQGAVTLPTKKEDKYGAAMAFINEHTVLFHEQAMRVYNGDSAAKAVEEVE